MVSCLGGWTGSKAVGVGSFYHQGAYRGSQSASILPHTHPLCLARGPLTCAPGLGACVLRAPSSSQPHPGTGLWATLSTNSHQTRAWTGVFSSIHLPDADSAQPSSATILLLGRGAWHLEAQLLGALASGSSVPHPASEASGPGPSWASEHQQLAGSCHLLFSEHQSPRHFHSADFLLCTGGSGQAWLLEPLSPPLPAHPRPPRWPRSTRQPRTENLQRAGF